MTSKIPEHPCLFFNIFLGVTPHDPSNREEGKERGGEGCDRSHSFAQLESLSELWGYMNLAISWLRAAGYIIYDTMLILDILVQQFLLN